MRRAHAVGMLWLCDNSASGERKRDDDEHSSTNRKCYFFLVLTEQQQRRRRRWKGKVQGRSSAIFFFHHVLDCTNWAFFFHHRRRRFMRMNRDVRPRDVDFNWMRIYGNQVSICVWVNKQKHRHGQASAVSDTWCEFSRPGFSCRIENISPNLLYSDSTHLFARVCYIQMWVTNYSVSVNGVWSSGRVMSCI